MVTVHPGMFMVAALESQVDPHEEQHPSGLIVKHDSVESNSVKRAVIIEVNDDEAGHPTPEFLKPGTIIYYQKEWAKIGDTLIIRRSDIIAWEEGDR